MDPFSRAATLTKVNYWTQEAKKRGASHLLVVCDQFDWTDYPVYVWPDQDLNEVLKNYQPFKNNMQDIMEIIPLNNENKYYISNNEAGQKRPRIETSSNTKRAPDFHMTLRPVTKKPGTK